jgi:drug/metabolite transporter (DMT)-like permease
MQIAPKASAPGGRAVPAPPMTEPTRANWLSIAALGLIWGGTFMVVAVALRDYGPVTVAAARTGLGALALVGLAWALGRPFPGRDWTGWRIVAVLSLLSSALPFFLLSWGQQHVPSAFAGLSMAVLPLFVLPLAALLGDHISLRAVLGVVVALVGIGILVNAGG